jgi:predicted DNA-binding WGR domain protein
MPEARTYLELSEESGSSHKFYEVVVSDVQVTIRYGRIGDAGQTKVSSFATPEKAQAEATKKINEKRRKGYEEAVQGVRQKRAVSRRQIVSLRLGSLLIVIAVGSVTRQDKFSPSPTKVWLNSSSDSRTA